MKIIITGLIITAFTLMAIVFFTALHEKDLSPCERWDGEVKQYYSSGELLSIHYYEKGLEVKPSVTYEKDGTPYKGLRVWDTVMYIDSIQDTISVQGSYVDGRAVGIHEKRLANDRLLRETMYDHEGFRIYDINYLENGNLVITKGRGLPGMHGPVYKFSSTGHLIYIKNYKECLLHGETAYFDTDGNIESKYLYDNGALVETIKSDAD
jgi:antitoxin component YwqK of YwqJK toxin-antitoxin module